MKKRFVFSVFNLFEDTSAEVVKLQAIFKGLVGTVAGTAYFSVSPEAATIAAVVGFAVNEILGCLKVVNEDVNS
jgi:hypothetical protein